MCRHGGEFERTNVLCHTGHAALSSLADPKSAENVVGKPKSENVPESIPRRNVNGLMRELDMWFPSYATAGLLSQARMTRTAACQKMDSHARSALRHSALPREHDAWPKIDDAQHSHLAGTPFAWQPNGTTAPIKLPGVSSWSEQLGGVQMQTCDKTSWQQPRGLSGQNEMPQQQKLEKSHKLLPVLSPAPDVGTEVETAAGARQDQQAAAVEDLERRGEGGASAWLLPLPRLPVRLQADNFRPNDTHAQTQTAPPESPEDEPEGGDGEGEEAEPAGEQHGEQELN